jgi:cystathionine gamma-synthase
MREETLAVHAGRHLDPGSRALSPAISLSTTFERGPEGDYPGGYVYGRLGNPNRDALEECVAALEGGAEAVAFASGSAATAAVLQCLGPGDHVLAPLDVYHGTARLLREVFGPWGLSATFVDMTDLEAAASAMRPETRLVWVETPGNPLMTVTDVAAVAALAHAHGALVCCDNTFATPVLQQPLALGADLALHAAAKYLGGHGDALAGVVVARARDGLLARLRTLQGAAGAVAAPLDCWLILRGVRTLPYRMRAHTAHAAAVAAFLADHPAVARVHYPGLPAHPGHAVAARQMRGAGGMLSFQVRGGGEAARRVAARVRLIARATSFWGSESLIEHRRSMEAAGSRTPDDLLRLSVGLEHPDDLVADLEQALA